MTSTAYEVAQYLHAQGAGVFASDAGWSINVSREPVSPNDAITIYDTGGPEPDTDQLDLLRPNFQVRVRSFDYPSAFAKQEQIRQLLIMTSPLIMTSTYIAVTMSTEISGIGRDDQDRHLLVANYRTIKERT